MPPPDGLITDTDMLRHYARYMAETADSLGPVDDAFAPGGPADIPGDAFRSRTGWLQVLGDELGAFRDSYTECQYATSLRVQRIRDALTEGGRLLEEAAMRYDRSDAEAARRVGRAGS